MNRSDFQRWLDDYVEAWKSYDPEKIGALFSEDAEYRHRPLDEPVVGRAAIVDDWLEERDAPGTYEAHYQPLAIDGQVHIAQGISRYFTSDGTLDDEFANVFVCRFNDQGACTAFTEYWTRNRHFDPEEGFGADA